MHVSEYFSRKNIFHGRTFISMQIGTLMINQWLNQISENTYELKKVVSVVFQFSDRETREHRTLKSLENTS